MKILFAIALSCLINATYAQQFIQNGEIEFEVKSNIKKTMGNSSWAEMLKDQMPEFKIGYYTFTFVDNKSLYKFNHWTETGKVPEYMRKSDEENSWYTDFDKKMYTMQKEIIGTKFIVEDSIKNIKWKLTNENRNIVGFNCRKAIGVIMDSVYVFAFYTDEITISGGPCSINGLPGMILGLTIPRMYTSFIATKVNVNAATETVKPIQSKKSFTNKTFMATLIERTKDWYSNNDDDNEESKNWKQQFFWGIQL